MPLSRHVDTLLREQRHVKVIICGLATGLSSTRSPFPNVTTTVCAQGTYHAAMSKSNSLQIPVWHFLFSALQYLFAIYIPFVHRVFRSWPFRDLVGLQGFLRPAAMVGPPCVVNDAVAGHVS